MLNYLFCKGAKFHGYLQVTGLKIIHPRLQTNVNEALYKHFLPFYDFLCRKAMADWKKIRIFDLKLQY